MLAVVLSLAIPMPIQAASKKPVNITISTKAKNVTVKKRNANRYTVTMRAGIKNAKFIAKAGKKNVTKSCKWKSNNKKIVTVKNNKLTAKKAGKCKVTVTYKGKKTVLNVTVTKKTDKPENTTEPTKCTHNWEKHWTVLEEEGECPSDEYTAFCYCGIFRSEEEFNNHLKKVQISGIFGTAQQKMCGLHGTEAKGECSSDIKDGICRWTLRTEYIDYMYCTKCNEHITSTFE